jgi:glycosyltransferase involved in cell wall biosynthesis
MRLLILTQYFPPEMGAPQTRLSELGERLIDRGWDVEVLTALPNYPTGKIFPGYDPLRPVVEHIGRMRTVRLPMMPAKTGFAKRLGSYFSFVASASALGPRYCQAPDLMFVESPPLFIGYAARYLSRRWRCPYVFNVSDLWPESAVRMGVVKPGPALRLAERLERSLYQHAAGATGQSQGIVDGIKARSPGTPVELITNGCAPARFGRDKADDEARALVGDEPGPVFMFAGLLGLAQGLEQILEVAKRLPDSVPGRFVLVGEGPVRELLEARIAAEGIRRVRLVPSQPKHRIPALLACADVAITTMGMSIPGMVPSKIYEAMASGLPILIAADGEPVKRIADADCGVSVPQNDPQALIAAFTRLATDAALRERLGKNGRHAAETVYDRDLIANRLDRFLRGILLTR